MNGTIDVATLQSVTNTDVKRKNVLNEAEYAAICEFIQNYAGLAIDCEIAMVQQQFTYICPLTLKCILQNELGNKQRLLHWLYEARAEEFLNQYDQLAENSNDATILLKMAMEEGLSPVGMCRAILKEKYPLLCKYELARHIKFPLLIKDKQLAANVSQCLCSDSQDGPLIDIRRRLIGEEYELKLKDMATKAGMNYYDEHDLRRLGYDKTPDIKMILPFLYKGVVVNWIESKAIFGDVKTHRSYLEQQLISYCNRFGHGIIIYWFGYHEDILAMSENAGIVTVLSDFPESKDIVLMDLESNNATQAKTAVDVQKSEIFQNGHDSLSE